MRIHRNAMKAHVFPLKESITLTWSGSAVDTLRMAENFRRCAVDDLSSDFVVYSMLIEAERNDPPGGGECGTARAMI